MLEILGICLCLQLLITHLYLFESVYDNLFPVSWPDKGETSILYCLSIICVLEVDHCCVSLDVNAYLLLWLIVSVSVIYFDAMFFSCSKTGFNLGLFLSSNSSYVVSMEELDASSLFLFGFFSSLAEVYNTG